MTKIRSERRGAVAVVTIDNPARRNAFTPEMRRELTRRMIEHNHAEDVRAIVITGANGNFCAGADLSRIGVSAAEPTFVQASENLKDVHHLARAVALSPKPVVSAVEGDAFGAGLSIVAASDVTVVARSARFGTSFAKIGIVPDMALLHSLPNRIGVAATRRLILTPTMLSGERAYEIGLADELVEEGSALDIAMEHASGLAQGAPIPIALAKMALAAGPLTLEQALAYEVMQLPATLASKDSKEGLAAFKERRPPRFVGN